MQRIEEAGADLERWPEIGHEVRTEAAVADHILNERVRAAATAARITPPDYITAELGQRPSDPTKAREWDRAVGGIEGYRTRNGVGDQPFDPKTVGDRAKRAWSQANEGDGEQGELRPALRPMTLHECRHTFASLLIDAGVNPKAIQEFMGHATIEETFSRYGHLMPGARDQARELVDAYMSAASEAA